MSDKEKVPPPPVKGRQQAMKDKAKDATLHKQPLGEKPPGHAKEQPQRKLG